MSKKPNIFVGDIYTSNRFGSFKVVEYINHREVIVEFLDTGYVTKATSSSIKKGLVKDKHMPLVKGVGCCDISTIDSNGKRLKEYQAWIAMLSRCYDEKYSNKYPTYKDCEVSDSFKNFSMFKSWCDTQTILDDYVLDKDILVKGNKTYSEDTCCFVPDALNLLFVNNKASRGKFPIGVTKARENRFRARLNKGRGVKEHLGYYNTQEEAFLAYKDAKEAYIKEVANKWKDNIDPRVYEALMNWEVDITD